MTEDITDAFEGELRVGGETGYRINLSRQVDRINALMSQYHHQFGMPTEAIRWGITSLEIMMQPYEDAKYIEDYKKALEKSGDDSFRFALKKYGLLMKLMARKNLLLEASKKGKM